MPQGGNGITAARALLETLSLDGGAGDRRCGLHTQSDTAQVILDRGGDYGFARKGTPPDARGGGIPCQPTRETDTVSDR